MLWCCCLVYQPFTGAATAQAALRVSQGVIRHAHCAAVNHGCCATVIQLAAPGWPTQLRMVGVGTLQQHHPSELPVSSAAHSAAVEQQQRVAERCTIFAMCKIFSDW